MKKLLLFVLAAVAFAACEQAPIEEQSVIRQEASETITVGFEGDDETRIQLNEAQKTVWTKGDLVSVFYRSNANQQWKYDGETGARTAELKRVDAGTSTRDIDRVVVVYPYNKDYYINPSTYNVQASLPAVQNYLKDSYGTNGNIMISSSEYNQFSLKSVCGWLKLQLTGDGEKIKSITLRGNNDEQVAGELYINSEDATAVLASEMGDADDNNAGGALVFDDTILREVVLDCGEGVELSADPTAFYIALPPQTFEKGFAVEITDAEAYNMELSYVNMLTIERNHIQPMAAVEFSNPNSYNTPANNEIWYTTRNNTIITPQFIDKFGVNIVTNTYSDSIGCIKFDGDVTTIPIQAFFNKSDLTSITFPNSLKSIGDNAFYWCYNLDSITIPDSVETIGENPFERCSISEFKGKYASNDGKSLIINNVLVSVATNNLSSYTIPDGVTTIGAYAFSHTWGLTSIYIPEGVTTIERFAFYDCGVIKTIVLPNTINHIGEYAFRDCKAIKSMNLSNVTSIKESAFSGCSELMSIILGDKLSSIEPGTFSGCMNLRNINIPHSVTYIGYDAFAGCENLTNITIPNNVTDIEYYAFSDCYSLSTITLSENLFWIGGGTFKNCPSISTVFSKSIDPPYIIEVETQYSDGVIEVWDTPFDDYLNFIIYVPSESVDAYKTADGWSKYASAIVGYDFENGVVVE